MYRTALAIVFALLVSLGSGCGGAGKTPQAHRGVLDLSTVQWPISTIIPLDGQWEFYWKQLLSPDDFHRVSPPAPSAHISLPDPWNNLFIQGENIGPRGYATYRLVVVLPGKGERELALKLADICSAYRLWANGKLIAEGGRIGKDAAGEIPNQSFRQPRLRVTGDYVELVLQVSNYHYYQAGVVNPIQIGPVEKVEAARFRQLGGVLFCAGSLLIMGIYHIAIFAFRRRDAAPLYFGVYCLCWVGNILTSNANGWVAGLFTGGLPDASIYVIDTLCFVITVAVCYSFLRTLYPEEFNRYISYGAWCLALIYLVMGFVLPAITVSSGLPAYYIYSILLIAYSLFRLGAALGNDREGAFFIFIGIMVLGGAGINDMLLDMGAIHSVYLGHMGLFVLILFQAMALSLRFSRAFSWVEQLSDELAEKNLTLEEGLAERNRLERKIIQISEDERRSLSHHLHDGLCQQLTGARLLFSVLGKNLAGAKGVKPDMQRLSSLLEESVNQAYDLSRGLWPVEHDPHGVSPSLEELVRRLGESNGIDIQFRQERGCAKCTNTDVTQMYRIAQEAVTNAVKHARAQKITVTLDCADRTTISLAVEDNGIGRAKASMGKSGLGMGIMSYRAGIIGGNLTVTDAVGGGTLVSCTAVCEQHAEVISNGF
ncbi:sensor histidine kinase, 7TMR-DISM_7TM domain-containing [Geotalea daltonii FRC-32]|uniref:Sensor histidine kinase, 7TMR-DISM_7TM domain-containing n=1 Tax=Geotalea daltonii (strain DSM 22248 / JCM 15807 / FRC-32) TaxID=316067 RepID=B9M3Z3_GEODF|nr:7TM diverse intracellular signaling domain-containing protein [Geotalea daltonii]ACM19636.1 sensor histidine kinase, 7TMR-DISM_7TM domain-containing [Geotalea daltonii FRC-32]